MKSLPSALILLYGKETLLLIVYGYRIWLRAANPQTLVENLTSVQRVMVLGVIRAYRRLDQCCYSAGAAIASGLASPAFVPHP